MTDWFICGDRTFERDTPSRPGTYTAYVRGVAGLPFQPEGVTLCNRQPCDACCGDLGLWTAGRAIGFLFPEAVAPALDHMRRSDGVDYDGPRAAPGAEAMNDSGGQVSKHPFPYEPEKAAPALLADIANMSYEERVSRTTAALGYAYSRGVDEVLGLGPTSDALERYVRTLVAGVQDEKELSYRVLDALRHDEVFRHARMIRHIIQAVDVACGIVVGALVGWWLS